MKKSDVTMRFLRQVESLEESEQTRAAIARRLICSDHLNHKADEARSALKETPDFVASIACGLEAADFPVEFRPLDGTTQLAEGKLRRLFVSFIDTALESVSRVRFDVPDLQLGHDDGGRDAETGLGIFGASVFEEEGFEVEDEPVVLDLGELTRRTFDDCERALALVAEGAVSSQAALLLTAFTLEVAGHCSSPSGADDPDQVRIERTRKAVQRARKKRSALRTTPPLA